MGKRYTQARYSAPKSPLSRPHTILTVEGPTRHGAPWRAERRRGGVIDPGQVWKLQSREPGGPVGVRPARVACSPPGGNAEHVAEHGLDVDEVEHVLRAPVCFRISQSSGRAMVYGYTPSGEYLVVVYEELDDDTVYPITVFPVEE